MKGWKNNVILAVNLVLFLACSVTQKTGKTDKTIIPSHKIDSLPVTIIEPEYDPIDSIALTDTTSKVNVIQEYLISQNGQQGVLELWAKKLEKPDFLKNKVITNIEFQDLKLPIDANRNINYLNQDF